MNIYLANALGQAGASTNARDVFFRRRHAEALRGRRLVPLVDDPHRHEQHPGSQVEAARHQEVDVRLFQFDGALFLETFDNGMLQLQFRDEANAGREGVAEDQDKAVEIQLPVARLGLVEMEIHVARHRTGDAIRTVGRGLGRRGRSKRKRQADLQGSSSEIPEDPIRRNHIFECSKSTRIRPQRQE